MAQKLRCVQPYRNGARGLVYEVGQEFTPSAQLRHFLLADAPGCFELVKEPVPEPEPAPVDRKALHKPPAHRAMVGGDVTQK